VKVIYDAIVKTIKKYEDRKLNREQESDETSDEDDDDGEGVDTDGDDEEPTGMLEGEREGDVNKTIGNVSECIRWKLSIRIDCLLFGRCLLHS
jgi:hypothetical protein